MPFFLFSHTIDGVWVAWPTVYSPLRTTDFWETFHGNFVQKCPERKSPKKCFFIYSFWCLTCGLNCGLMSNKLTHLLLDYGDYIKHHCEDKWESKNTRWINKLRPWTFFKFMAKFVFYTNHQQLPTLPTTQQWLLCFPLKSLQVSSYLFLLFYFVQLDRWLVYYNSYIIGHYKSSVIDLVSHTIYVVCFNFIHKSRDLRFKVGFNSCTSCILKGFTPKFFSKIFHVIE